MFATKNFASLTIDCLYLYFGMCAEIFATKKNRKWSQFTKNANITGREISRFRVVPKACLVSCCTVICSVSS